MNTSCATTDSHMTTSYLATSSHLSVSSITTSSQMSVSSGTTSSHMSTSSVPENARMMSSVMNMPQIRVRPVTESSQITVNPEIEGELTNVSSETESSQMSTNLEIENFEIGFDSEAYFSKKFTDIEELSAPQRAALREITKNLTKKKIDEFADALSPEQNLKLRKYVRRLVTSCVNEADALQRNNKKSADEEKEIQTKLARAIKKILKSVPRELRNDFAESTSTCAQEQAKLLKADESIWSKIKDKLKAIFTCVGIVVLAGVLAIAVGSSLLGAGLLVVGGITGFALLIYARRKANQNNEQKIRVKTML